MFSSVRAMLSAAVVCQVCFFLLTLDGALGFVAPLGRSGLAQTQRTAACAAVSTSAPARAQVLMSAQRPSTRRTAHAGSFPPQINTEPQQQE
jgi:hypothetical protein